MTAALLLYLKLCLSYPSCFLGEQRRQENSIAARQTFFSKPWQKNLGHVKEREKEGSSFFCGTLPKPQESHICQAFFV